MSCDRFWRDGIRMVEEGVHDAHGDTCTSCRRAVQEYQRLAAALGMIGRVAPGAVSWQDHVWREVRGLQRATSPVGRWWFALRVGTICTLIAVCLIAAEHEPAPPRVEVVASSVAAPSRAADVGDRVRITVQSMVEIRIYRRERLVLRSLAEPRVFTSTHAHVTELALELPGAYNVVVIASGASPSGATFDADLAALRETGAEFQVTEITVR